MPKLTDDEFIAIHRELAALVNRDIDALLKLPRDDLRALMTYFRPSDVVARSDALAARGRSLKEDTALEERALSAFAKIESAELSRQRTSLRRSREQSTVTGSTPRTGRRRQKQHHLSVRGELRDSPDVQRLARAIIAMGAIQYEHQKRVDAYLATDDIDAPEASNDHR